MGVPYAPMCHAESDTSVSHSAAPVLNVFLPTCACQGSIPRGWLKEVNPFGQPIYINVKSKEKVRVPQADTTGALVCGDGVMSVPVCVCVCLCVCVCVCVCEQSKVY